MKSLIKDQQIAMLVVPLLLFGVLGVSYPSAYERSFSEERPDAIGETRESSEDTRDMEIIERLLADDKPQEGAQTGGEPGNEMQQAILSAVENNDYRAFMQAAANTPFGDVMTKEAFGILAKAHELHRAGDPVAVHDHLRRNGLIPPEPSEKV